jgi:choline dehydrogenase-like flavoprotein
MIRRGTDVSGGFTLRTDVCVIGSGAGGGVATGILAELGREVVVLEEGPAVTKADFNQRDGDMYPLLYRDGGNQTTVDGGISVVQGRAVGGSTVVNMADVVPIPREIAEYWRDHHGLSRYSIERILEVGEACAQALGTNTIPEPSLNRNNALLLQGGRAIGLDGGTFRHNRVGCVGAGACMIGCAYDAKRSVALTWIPDAVATGRVMVQADARVEGLEWSGDRIVAAVGHVINQADQRPLGAFRVEADRFVLAAGAIHSPLLLQASGLGGSQVGRNLILQPQAPVAATFADPVVAFRGVPQSSFLDSEEIKSRETGLGGYRLEGIFATPAMTAATWGVHGAYVHEVMTKYAHTAGCLCLVPDEPTGTVTRLDNGRPKIEPRYDRAWTQTLMTAIHTAARVYLAAGAEQVLLPFAGATPARSEADLDQFEQFEISPNRLPMLSAHPQGSCRMGPDPATSVVGLDMRLHGVKNLQVLDASVFPTSSSSHTMIPTMTMAWLGAAESV